MKKFSLRFHCSSVGTIHSILVSGGQVWKLILSLVSNTVPLELLLIIATCKNKFKVSYIS